MFCGKCGAQVSDGAAVCPKCGNQLAAKTQAPKMNQASQNAGAKASGAAGNSGNGLDVKKIGIIAGAVAAVIVLIFVLKGIFGGGGLDGTYISPEGEIITFDGNKLIYNDYNERLAFTVKCKVKGENITINSESVEFTKETLEYFENELDYDKDKIEKELESVKNNVDEMAELKFEFDEDGDELTLNRDGRIRYFFYAENYEIGPSGEYISEEDDEVTISFKNGKATFNNDGDKETLTYYCFDTKHWGVKIVFYGEGVYDSDYYDVFDSLSAILDDDEITIKDTHVFEK